MKKTILTLAAAMFVTGAMLTSCSSPEKKADNAEQKVEEAKADMKDAKQELSQAQKEEASMRQNRFPPGWDEDKARRVLAHYEGQTEEEQLAEDEAGMESSDTVMNVPHDLLPKVRELIAKHQS